MIPKIILLVIFLVPGRSKPLPGTRPTPTIPPAKRYLDLEGRAYNRCSFRSLGKVARAIGYHLPYSRAMRHVRSTLYVRLGW